MRDLTTARLLLRPIGPDDARFAYVYAIALADRGDLVGSRAVLERAHARAPADVDVRFALWFAWHAMVPDAAAVAP